jgi:hypothetical protein
VRRRSGPTAPPASRLTLRGAAEDAHDVDVLFASPTVMLWLVHPAGDRVATPARIVLQAHGNETAAASGRSRPCR